MIKLELATNAAMVCWQSNGTFNAKALLSSDSLTNDNLLAWTISGSGPAVIDSAGVVSFGPAPGSYTVHVADAATQLCGPSMALEVMQAGVQPPMRRRSAGNPTGSSMPRHC